MKRPAKTSPLNLYSFRSPLQGLPALPDAGAANTIRWAALRSRLLVWLERHPEARDALVESLTRELGLNDDTKVQL